MLDDGRARRNPRVASTDFDFENQHGFDRTSGRAHRVPLERLVDESVEIEQKT
jgi:hypothetical protein